MDTNARLAEIAAGTDQKLKSELYKEVLSQVFSAASVEGCRAFVDHSALCFVFCIVTRMNTLSTHTTYTYTISFFFPCFLKPETNERCHFAVLSESVPLVLSRHLLQVFAQGISSLPPQVHKPVAKE
jgi:hypothetical protein